MRRSARRLNRMNAGSNVIRSAVRLALGVWFWRSGTAKDEFEYSVATVPPTARQRQFAFVVVIATLAAYGAVAPFAGLPLPRYRQLHSGHGGHHIRDRPRHGRSAVRSVLGNRLTRTPGARERLSLFQSDCHSIRTDLSGRVCADGSSWGRTSERRLAQCFPFASVLPWRPLAYALLTSGKHTKDSIEPSPRRAISGAWRSSSLRCVR